MKTLLKLIEPIVTIAIAVVLLVAIAVAYDSTPLPSLVTPSGCSSAGCNKSAAEWKTFLDYTTRDFAYGSNTPWIDPNTDLGTSDEKVPTQAAVKSYVDAHVGGGGGASFWTAVTNFVAAPANNATITTNADLTSILKPGMPLEITIANVIQYDIISAANSANITVKGVALGGNIQTIKYGDVSRVSVIPVSFPLVYDGSNSPGLIYSLLNSYLHWDKVTSFLVEVILQTQTPDSAGNALLYPSINGSNVLFAGINAVVANATYDSGVSIDSSKYSVDFGGNIDVGCVAGKGGNAFGATFRFIFVTP